MGLPCDDWEGRRLSLPMRKIPPVLDVSDTAWHAAKAQLRNTHQDLIAAVVDLPDARLFEVVPGKQGTHYTFYYMLHGVAQHEAYHAGQIALLKKASQ